MRGIRRLLEVHAREMREEMESMNFAEMPAAAKAEVFELYGKVCETIKSISENRGKHE